jgi:GH18 family chitinase
LAAFDWVNIMAYDLTGPWNPESPGPHSPYEFSVNSVQYWSENGLEKDKMVLGVPFYGYDFNDVNNVQGFSYADMIANNPDYAYQDKVEEAYYNGIPTIVDKTNFAIDENLAGVMIWELGQDDYSELSLLNAIFETIQSRTTTSRFYANQLSISPPYPNPTSNSLFLNLSKFPSTQIEIYAPSLKRFQTINVTNSNALSEINLSKYPAGWYIVRLTSGKESKSFKIIKN